MSDAAERLVDEHGERIQEWEDSDDEVLRALSRAIQDNANGKRE